jgi:peptide/nickel transport system permease protein
MISDARLYLTVIPLAALAPMTALALLIIGINLAVDALGKTLGIDRVRGGGQ